MSKETGGQAFPKAHNSNYQDDRGMTLRDYFAAKALAGILAGDHPITHELDCLKLVAVAAYRYADAMMEARK